MRMRKVARASLLGVLMAAALQSPTAAQAPADAIIEQLREQGYEEFTVSRTFLGRVRIVAEADGRWREIVFNPVTGEILRDFAEAVDGDVTPQIVVGPNGDGSDAGSNNGSDSNNPSDIGGEDNSSPEDDGDPDGPDNDDDAGRPDGRDGVNGPDRNQTDGDGGPGARNDGDDN